MSKKTLPSYNLNTPIQYVKGVGPALAERLKQKNILTIEDALYFLPRTYEDRQNIKKIKDIFPGHRETSFGVIQKIALIPLKTRKQKIFVMTISDTTGFVHAKWFRFNLAYMKARYKVGMQAIFSGEIKIFRYQKEIVHPDIEIIENGNTDSLHFGRIVPIYSQTEGLHQKTIRRIIKKVLDITLPSLQDSLPENVRKHQDLLDLKTSFQEVHFPLSLQSFEQLMNQKHPARRRIVFDEFFFLELGLALRKTSRTKEKTIAFKRSENLKNQLLNFLPFSLTNSQKQVIHEIEENLAQPYPMNRLLQGDVGSGKTIVALICALSVLEQGYQVAFMVPTEILAEQHFYNIQSLLSKLQIRTSLLKSDLKQSDKTKLLQEIKTGFFQCVIGTHAIIEDSVSFEKLGFIIVDEQHRFGVEQRLQFKQKGNHPHLLVMTATPIPRTLALTVYGDLDLSIMTELPAGRKAVITRVVKESERLKLYEFMKKELSQQKQAYVVYPLIEESEKVDLRDATQMTEHLRNVFKNFCVALIHGRMKGEDKNKIMKAFKENKIQILVSTTVIEVGIDVPNSTLMVVEHAERFGLSQLHQLRGRIGRGMERSYCFLLAAHMGTDESRERLKAMEAYQSGFKIAEIDLRLRGPGEFLGTRQSGLAGFRVANIATDAEILIQARKEAFEVVEKDPLLLDPEHLPLKNALRHHWQKKLDFINAG